MAKRILVLSAAVGAGHMRAAQAVELALREVAPDALVRNVDVLTLTNDAFRKLYAEAYLDLVNKAPHVLGYFYDMMDRPRRAGSTRDKLRLAMEKVNLRKLCEELECGAWVQVTGIPIHPVFAQSKPRDACLERQGLRGDRPIVLQLSGGFGVGSI